MSEIEMRANPVEQRDVAGMDRPRLSWQTPKIRLLSAREAEVGPNSAATDGGFTLS